MRPSLQKSIMVELLRWNDYKVGWASMVEEIEKAYYRFYSLIREKSENNPDQAV